MSPTALNPETRLADDGPLRIRRLVSQGVCLSQLSDHQLELLQRTLVASDFVYDAAQREPDIVAAVLGEPESLIVAEFQALKNQAEKTEDEAALGRLLRRARRRIMLAIAIADLGELATLGQGLAWLSRLADCAVQLASQRLYGWLIQRWGTPRNAEGEAQLLVVLGMGKLGGQELNFSSDIDLIFAYPEEGETDGQRSRSNAEFFRRLGQQLIRVLDEVTEQGFVFRVDMRLRPNGDAGALAHSFAALEHYYQREGRDWERYALIKARPLTEDGGAGQELLDSLRPFVYRRYLDFSAIEALREMKGRVSREVVRRGMEGNIKLGLGGIREIEFICQVFQLIRGGTEPELRTRSLETALRVLAQLEILPRETTGELTRAYRFLRVLENRIQAIADQQTHELPTEQGQCEQLLLAMRMATWEELLDALSAHQRVVHEHFRSVFADSQDQGGEQAPGPFESLWSDELTQEQALNHLASEGFDQPGAALRSLQALKQSKPVRALSAGGHQRLDRLLPRLMEDVASTGGSQQALERVLNLVSAVARRSAYVSLLVENPGARRRVVSLCGDSAWIASQVTAHPLLLDELLEQPRPAPRAQLESEMGRRLKAAEDQGLEAEMDALRSLQQAQKLRIAVAEISGAIGPMGAAAALSDLAEVVLGWTLKLARRDLVQRHGQPIDVEGGGKEYEFGIVAYGRLGARELGYESDLDLVFLHQQGSEKGVTSGPKAIPVKIFFMRLTQRLIHHMQVLTGAGRLYEVDVRLRPDGGAGMLVCPMGTYASYQLERAWTWERQSLVRARMLESSDALNDPLHIPGDNPDARPEGSPKGSLMAEFAAARLAGLQRAPGENLAQEVTQMRAKMGQELGRSEGDLKHAPGGFVDLDFALQYTVLRWADEHPQLVAETGTGGLLKAIAGVGIISDQQCRELGAAHRELHRLQHQQLLTGNQGNFEDIAKATKPHRALITKFYQQLLDG